MALMERVAMALMERVAMALMERVTMALVERVAMVLMERVTMALVVVLTCLHRAQKRREIQSRRQYLKIVMVRVMMTLMQTLFLCLRAIIFVQLLMLLFRQYLDVKLWKCGIRKI
jgi:hypothetical protein